MHESRRGRRVWRIIFWAALIGALLCLAVTVGYYCSRYWTARKYAQVRDEVALDQTERITETEEPGANPTLEEIENAEFTGMVIGPEPKIPLEVLTDAEDHPVDFEKLEEINPELYAWIRIPGTKIDYPVAQHQGEDQNYYLKHDLYRTPQFAGCIFSQEPSAKDMTDPVTVLYGHNMRNESMFQNLYHFLKEEEMEEDRYVYIYTKDRTFVYRIYCATYGDNRNITQAYDFAEPEELENYIEDTKHPRFMEARTSRVDEVSTEDRILTLSTCVYGQPSERLLVHAVQMYGSESETETEIQTGNNG